MYFHQKENKLPEREDTSHFKTVLTNDIHSKKQRDSSSFIHSYRNVQSRMSMLDRDSSQIHLKQSVVDSILCENPIEKIRQKTLALKKKIEFVNQKQTKYDERISLSIRSNCSNEGRERRSWIACVEEFG